MTDPAVWPQVGDTVAVYRHGVVLTTVVETPDRYVVTETGHRFSRTRGGLFGGLREVGNGGHALLRPTDELVVDELAAGIFGGLLNQVGRWRIGPKTRTEILGWLDEIDQLTAAARAAVNNLTDQEN